MQAQRAHGARTTRVRHAHDARAMDAPINCEHYASYAGLASYTRRANYAGCANSASCATYANY
eukprot:5390132-Lingulodinium_polyedra.AAC.1